MVRPPLNRSESFSAGGLLAFLGAAMVLLLGTLHFSGGGAVHPSDDPAHNEIRPHGDSQDAPDWAPSRPGSDIKSAQQKDGAERDVEDERTSRARLAEQAKAKEEAATRAAEEHQRLDAETKQAEREKAAEILLQHGRNFEANAKFPQAYEKYRQVIDEFADTKAAKAAQERIDAIFAAKK